MTSIYDADNSDLTDEESKNNLDKMLKEFGGSPEEKENLERVGKIAEDMQKNPQNYSDEDIKRKNAIEIRGDLRYGKKGEKRSEAQIIREIKAKWQREKFWREQQLKEIKNPEERRKFEKAIKKAEYEASALGRFEKKEREVQARLGKGIAEAGAGASKMVQRFSRSLQQRRVASLRNARAMRNAQIRKYNQEMAELSAPRVESAQDYNTQQFAISLRNQEIFDELARAQNDMKQAELNRIRLNREKQEYRRRTNMMNAHHLLNKTPINFIDTENHILKERPDSVNILRQNPNSISVIRSNRPHILTGSTPNNVLLRKIQALAQKKRLRELRNRKNKKTKPKKYKISWF